MVGQTLANYHVLEKLGEGAMGVLYRARDTRLDRDVAIKVLRADGLGDAGHRQRLLREAKAASALNHPQIVTVHDIGRALVDGHEVDFIAMEYVSGRCLDKVMGDRRLGVEEAIDIAIQIAGALATAHAAGIVHRDIKPANVMLSEAGAVKLLDFGLAKATQGREVEPAASTATDDSARLPSATGLTRPGAPVGTPAYMSPEQAEGLSVDPRSDVFAVGVVLYEVLGGRRPFLGASRLSVLAAILRDTPPSLRSLRHDVPRDVERAVERCLAKSPDARYASAAELLADLTACQARLIARMSGWRAVLGQPHLVAALAVAVLIAGTLLALVWVRHARVRRARTVTLPEIERLVASNESETGNFKAYWLAREAALDLPGTPQLDRFWRDRCYPLSLRTDPPGATAEMKDYADPASEWKSMGPTPLEEILVPYDSLRWRITKDGFEPLEITSNPGRRDRELKFTLARTRSAPAGMVRVEGARFQLRGHPVIELQDYWLDRYEVTNRQFKEFLDKGGYRSPEHWKLPFVKDGRHLSWSEAVASFVDTTGRHGPATWEAGSYPEGQDEFPVGGVSHYEAAAYASFVGKELPTFYHWLGAADGVWTFPFTDVHTFSNFAGAGPVGVGTLPGMSPYGNLDMLGNVREWCATEFRGRRYALGGAWTDPPIAYFLDNAQSPWTREPANGFRCVRYTSPLDPKLMAAVHLAPQRDSRTRPASDEVFEAYRSFYAYDRVELRARIEATDEMQDWRRDRVSYDAAYGRERALTHLFLPRNARPPYQAVVYSPTIEAYHFKSSDDIRTTPFDYLMRSGRAVLHPVYAGTYERHLSSGVTGSSEIRDLVIASVKDVRRGLDYLESRGDIDSNRLAMLGISDTLSTIAPALDERLKATVIQGGGLIDMGRPPETDPFHFAPRVRVPALVLAGRYDPLPDAVRGASLVKLLGTPDKDKRLVFVDSGHSVRRSRETVRETLDWLDRHLGPVEMFEASSR